MKWFLLITIFTLAVFSGCGDSDSSEDPHTEHNNNSADAGHEGDDSGQSGDEDVSGEPDATEECDPSAVAQDALGLVDEVSPGTVEVSAEGPPLTLRVDAALGGASEAASHAWVYVNMIEGTKVEVTDEEALSNGDWLLAFKRTEIRVNGGDSGSGPWLMTRVSEPFDTAAVPGRDVEWGEDNFVDENCEVATFGQGMLLTAFGQWYDYDPVNHVISVPESETYVFYNAAQHSVFKLEISAYEDGVYTLRFASMF